MQKKFQPLLFLFLVLLFTSCNSNSDGKEDKGKDTVNATVKDNPPPPAMLDMLYIERAEFDNFPNGPKLVYTFAFQTTTTITLNGWQLNGVVFTALPGMKLKTLQSSTIPYAAGLTMGNLIIEKKEIDKIKAALVPGMTMVVFSPKLDGNAIKYDILVSDGTKKDGMLATSPTGADVNPSPPKTY
jgi:hypothetical protein